MKVRYIPASTNQEEVYASLDMGTHDLVTYVRHPGTGKPAKLAITVTVDGLDIYTAPWAFGVIKRILCDYHKQTSYWAQSGPEMQDRIDDLWAGGNWPGRTCSDRTFDGYMRKLRKQVNSLEAPKPLPVYLRA